MSKYKVNEAKGEGVRGSRFTCCVPLISHSSFKRQSSVLTSARGACNNSYNYLKSAWTSLHRTTYTENSSLIPPPPLPLQYVPPRKYFAEELVSKKNPPPVSCGLSIGGCDIPPLFVPTFLYHSASNTSYRYRRYQISMAGSREVLEITIETRMKKVR